MKTLLVEDDTSTRLMMEEILRQRNHTVSSHSSAESARQEIETSEFDMLVLDVILPGEDGLKFCQWLRSRPGGDKPVVLIVTAYVKPSDLEQVLRAGADDYILKPYQLDTIQIRLAFAEIAVKDREKRIRAEREKEGYFKRLEYAQRIESLGVLANGIAHDFNNILAGILGSASLAMMDPHASDDVKTNLKQIESLSLRAAALCTQMMSYAGQNAPNLEPLDFVALIEDTVNHWISESASKVLVTIQHRSQLRPIRGDRGQLEQAVRSLMTNALEALQDKDGGITVRTYLEHPSETDFSNSYWSPELPGGEYLLLEVTDQGCGMTEDVRTRIFDPFFSTKFAGRGLGLAALAGIIRTHKGAISVESTPGQGSTFKVWLPFMPQFIAPAQGESTEPTTLAIQDRPPADAKGYKRILLAEDEESVRKIVAKILRENGYEVVTARDGREAIQIMEAGAEDYDIALLDLSMPRVDGIQAAERIRRLRPDLRIVLMSGYSEEQAMSRFSKSICDAFLTKPFTVIDMREKLSPSASA